MKTICVTIPKRQADFIDKNCLVLSKLFQQKLDVIIKQKKKEEDE